MKYFLLSLPALALVGCSAGGAKCDSGDTSCESLDSGNTPDYYLESYNYSDVGGNMVWTIETTAEIGTVQLDLIETGDPSYDCSQPDNGQLICGVWTEYHTNFQLVGASDFGGDVKEISLEIKDDYRDQINNQSTLFDTELGSTVTLLIQIWDTNGDLVDCVTNGHSTSYFADICTNVF